ncbi:MAG TPA: TetR/AcrR family transcriptional regulator [Kofleriaceae bacterium]|jgi:AcrR family transcriptional regulator
MAREVIVLDPLKKERRKQILDAAKHVFAEAGYHGASIHAIIERAGIARGTFYLYFESKSAVFSSILDQATTDLRRHMHRIEVDNPKIPPQLQLRAQVIDALEYVVQDRPLAMLLLSAGHTPDAEAAERLDQFFAEVRDLLRRAFESGQEIKLLRKVQPELLAAAMLGMIRGVVEMIITQPDAPKVEQVVDELLTVALRGVLA